MSDNSFEKKVRQELQGFGVTPSEKVWAQLEAGLKERKRRRGGFIWYFLGTLLLGGGVWLAVKQSSHPAEMVIAETNNQKVLKNTPALKPSPEYEKTITGETKQQPGQKIIPPINASTTKIAENNPSKNTSYSTLKRTSAEAAVHEESTDETTITPSVPLPEKNPKLEGNREEVKGNAAGTNRASAENNTLPAPSDQKLPVISGQSEAVADSTSFASITKKSESPQPGSSQPEQARKRKLERPKKWELNLTGSVGLSAVTSGFLEAGTKSGDMFNTGNFGPTMPIHYTHSQEKSFGFSGGAEVRRWFTKSVAMSAGLQYQFQRTNSLVGTMSNTNLVVYNGYQDLTVDRFYLPGALSEYRNRYHLIDLPLQVQVAWGHKKLPFIAGMGVQPGILLGSNAMIKDRSGILFTDKENFNRFQFGFNAGLSVRLMKNSKMPLELGPQLQYRLTNIFKEETGYKGHLFYLGLQAKWRLLSF